MYPRNIELPTDHSFFLFGPRGTGKSTLVRSRYPNATYIDLLDFSTYRVLLANPNLLSQFIPPQTKEFIIIDEVQKIPALLDEVHRLIESQDHYKFILTGSSARKLRRQGVNLLAGRAYTSYLYPLTAIELGKDFSLKRSLEFGCLPQVYVLDDPKAYLESYINTYLKEEVLQEGLTRNLSAFARFLEIVSLSVGSPVNTSEIARDVAIDRKVIENYFTILEDMMIGIRLPVFSRRAKRRVVVHPKFYFFDTGIYHTVRPKGPLDITSEINGFAVENLFLQNLIAVNSNLGLGYQLHFYRTVDDQEVDFVAYGEKGLLAFEIKLGTNFNSTWVKSLVDFGKDYPEAKLFLIYGGTQKLYYKNVTILPIEEALKGIERILRG